MFHIREVSDPFAFQEYWVVIITVTHKQLKILESANSFWQQQRLINETFRLFPSPAGVRLQQFDLTITK